MSKHYEELEQRLEKAMALQTAMVLFEWDNETLAPKMAAEATARVIGSLSGEYQRIMTDEETISLAKLCCEETDCLTPAQQAVLREYEKEYEQLEVIPPDEYRAYRQLISRATMLWADARAEKNFELFAPVLEQIVDYQKRFASYRAKEGQSVYDVMLDTYEPGFDMETLDRFFGALKEELTPMVKEAAAKSETIEDGFLTGDYPEEKQEQLARFLAEYVGFDFSRGVLAVSAHPFTTNLHNKDVRITTHYSDRVDSSIFSVIHETGHALYEMGIGDELTQTLAGQGTSMGMHESQSRFFENIIGRSRAFWEPVYGKVQELFPEQLGEVSLDAFLRAVNRVQPGLIRIDADEVTYSLHIMIRYELEKRLIGGEIQVRELPELWDSLYEEYLGVRPENASEGVLQDIHWSQGSFGYFPSYALGSAFGAQMMAHMRQVMDVDGLLRAGRIDEIREYLRLHVHRYGKLKSSRQILKDMTGEDFNPAYYLEYLRRKTEQLGCAHAESN